MSGASALLLQDSEIKITVESRGPEHFLRCESSEWINDTDLMSKDALVYLGLKLVAVAITREPQTDSREPTLKEIVLDLLESMDIRT